jgi:hypothetical protein
VKGTQLRLAILFFCTAGSLLILQSAFDSSDHRKAERAVRYYTVGGPTLEQLLEKRAPGGVWSTEITHGCRGVVRTSYSTATQSWDFDYEVPAHAIHPGNEPGRAVLLELTDGKPAPPRPER